MRDIVVYVGSIMLPDKSAGAQRALSLSKSFRDLGYQVVIIGMEKGCHQERSILSTRNTCQGFDTYAVPQPASIRQWVHHTISIKEFTEVIEFYGVDRVKCVVAMEYEAIALYRLATYCKKNKIALIADAEEWYEHSTMGFPMNVAKDFDTWLRMYYVYPKCIKNMICISRFFYEHYEKEIQNRVYIPGTIDPAEEKWKLPQYTPNEVFTIGYAGNPGTDFGKERLDLLIQAVRELNAEGNPCILEIAGVDEKFLSERMGSVIHSMVANEEMVCHGMMTHQECLQMIARCDYSAIVREDKRVTRAGFPTKLSESFGCGTPVISTKTSNIEEYIAKEHWGVIGDGYMVEMLKRMIKEAMVHSYSELQAMHAYVISNNPLQYACYNEPLELFLNNLQ